jgi:WhiB family transcriptional regulator, redox-sensing transcriptional regulator
MRFVRPMDEAWRAQAQCRDLDPNIFFPYAGQFREIERAKAICNGCPVRQECLDYANTTRQRIGVWGGMTDRERRRYRREQLKETVHA